MSDYKHVMIAIDGSDESAKVLARGMALAKYGTQVSVVQVFDTLVGNYSYELNMGDFALAQREPLAARLRQHCRRAGRAAQAEAVVAWLSQVVQTVLPGPGVALSGLHQVLPEMEFWLPARALLSRGIDALCCTHLLPGVARPSLAERQLRGMLMGFADLVFEHGGRYWVLDYKSNHLGDQDAAYDAAALAQAMALHRYDVQGALYMLALHRLLKARLGSSYQPEQQLGGAVYLFLRGVQGPERGVCLLPPSLASPRLSAPQTRPWRQSQRRRSRPSI